MEGQYPNVELKARVHALNQIADAMALINLTDEEKEIYKRITERLEAYRKMISSANLQDGNEGEKTAPPQQTVKQKRKIHLTDEQRAEYNKARNKTAYQNRTKNQEQEPKAVAPTPTPKIQLVKQKTRLVF